MQSVERMLEIGEKLEALGHETFVSQWAKDMIGKSDEEKETMKLHQKTLSGSFGA